MFEKRDGSDDDRSNGNEIEAPKKDDDQPIEGQKEGGWKTGEVYRVEILPKSFRNRVNGNEIEAPKKDDDQPIEGQKEGGWGTGDEDRRNE
ncbi:MAG: hypothetical protein SWK76_17185 [Actinomycetota bacterium]|nr:hypothetical protein [Actinomycetota bacterium]